MSSVPYIPNPETAPPDDISDICLSFYYYVKNRILGMNAQRAFGGFMQARDWPFREAKMETFYLVALPSRPSRVRGNSQSGPMYCFNMQWSWMIQGDDLPQNAQGANRGNKFAIEKKMETEIVFGLFPGFCGKNKYSLSSNGNGNPVLDATPFSPPDSIWWNFAGFADKQERSSGILFGTATVEVTAFMPAING